jgi:hypothetical protein
MQRDDLVSATLSEAWRRWLQAVPWTRSVAFTAHIRAGNGEVTKGTKEQRSLAASRHNRFFCARVDRAVFGSCARSRRGGRRVPRMLVIEEGASRTHVHGFFCFPPWVDDSRAEEILTHAWVRSPCGVNDVVCKPMQDSAFDIRAERTWGDYILKQVNYDNAVIDLGTLVLPNADNN